MNPRIQLSGVVVCQDNEATIEPVLASLEPHVDEIVVVDGGSHDATIERALRSDKVRLYEREFTGNIAEQKNFAFDQCFGDWVLILDTDELLGGQNLQWIRRLTQLPFMGWFSLPRYWLVEREGRLEYLTSKRYYRDRQLRLFRNIPEHRYDSSARAIHHEFREKKGGGRPLRNPHLYHFDLLMQDRAAREAKVARYRRAEPQSEDVHQMYLYEDHDVPSAPLPVPPAVRLDQLARQATEVTS